MGANRVLAALAVAAVPFLLASWIELVSVDQPQEVRPGASFDSTIEAVVHVGPMPLYDPPAESTRASSRATDAIRLGVLTPSDWTVDKLTWSIEGGAGGTLDQTPAEMWRYEAYYPAPPGYEWRTFSGADQAVRDGAELSYHAHITTADANGIFRVVYMTSPDAGYPFPAEDEFVLPPDGPAMPYPGPSILETEIVVGTVGPTPRVTSWDPPDGTADVPIGTDIRVGFSRDMDVDSLRTGGVLLYGGPVWYATGRPSWADPSPLAPDYVPPPWPPSPVPALVFYNTETRTAVIDPVEPLLPHTVYTAVATPAARAKDGVPLAGAATATFLTAPAPPRPLFSDVPPDHRFHAAIKTLFEAGIIDGYPDGTFRPDAPVTRAHVAKWLVLILGIHTPQADPSPPFRDLPPAAQDPMSDYIGEAAQAGITVGFDDGTFRPLETVTRIQLVRMIVRAAQGMLTAPPPGFSAGFHDVDLTDQGFVNWAHYNDLVDGKAPGRFDPWSTATRGHAARILYGVWNLTPRPLPLPGPGTD